MPPFSYLLVFTVLPGLCAALNSSELLEHYEKHIEFNECQHIPNCEPDEVFCMNNGHSQCARCKFFFGPTIKAYKRSEDWTECNQLCSWRPDSLFCYPGTCGRVETCRCAENYGGPNCLNIQSKPVLMHCIVKAQKIVDGDVDDFLDVPCHPPGPILYTNMRVSHIHIRFDSRFHGPSLIEYPLPFYINPYGFRLGVVDAGVELTISRPGGEVLPAGGFTCDEDMSEFNPNHGVVVCMRTAELTMPIQHADRLDIRVYVENGGFVEVTNYDHGIVDPPLAPFVHTYDGHVRETTSSIKFDFKPPFHCYPCNKNWLDVGAHYTRNNVLTMSWDGWDDEPSGIKLYKIELFLMEYLGGELNYLFPTLEERILGSIVTRTSFDLQNTGMYAALLTVEDNSGNDGAPGNYIFARRFFLFDDHSDITVNELQPLRVESAAENTTHQWLTDLTSMVSVKWHQRYYNEYHHMHRLLSSIGDHTQQANVLLEDTTGQPPLLRSREEIPNVNGIYRYRWQILGDRQGGESIKEPTDLWDLVPNFQSEEILFGQEREDGDSLRFFVEAADVMNNTKIESVLVHVDSSPPVIQDVWLVRDLHSSRLHFKAVDIHSGLTKVGWAIEYTLGKIVLKTGILPVVQPQKSEGCNVPDCFCTPMSDCFMSSFTLDLSEIYMDITDRLGNDMLDVTLSATNKAQLETEFVQRMNASMLLPMNMVESATPIVLIVSATLVALLIVAVTVVIVIVFYMKRADNRENAGCQQENHAYEDVQKTDRNDPNPSSVYTNLNLYLTPTGLTNEYETEHGIHLYEPVSGGV